METDDAAFAREGSPNPASGSKVLRPSRSLGSFAVGSSPSFRHQWQPPLPKAPPPPPLPTLADSARVLKDMTNSTPVSPLKLPSGKKTKKATLAADGPRRPPPLPFDNGYSSMEEVRFATRAYWWKKRVAHVARCSQMLASHGFRDTRVVTPESRRALTMTAADIKKDAGDPERPPLRHKQSVFKGLMALLKRNDSNPPDAIDADEDVETASLLSDDTFVHKRVSRASEWVEETQRFSNEVLSPPPRLLSRLPGATASVSGNSLSPSISPSTSTASSMDRRLAPFSPKPSRAVSYETGCAEPSSGAAINAAEEHFVHSVRHAQSSAALKRRRAPSRGKDKLRKTASHSALFGSGRAPSPPPPLPAILNPVSVFSPPSSPALPPADESSDRHHERAHARAATALASCLEKQWKSA
jgi:hypothetical protein